MPYSSVMLAFAGLWLVELLFYVVGLRVLMAAPFAIACAALERLFG
jgi:hypothetical protein